VRLLPRDPNRASPIARNTVYAALNGLVFGVEVNAASILEPDGERHLYDSVRIVRPGFLLRGCEAVPGPWWRFHSPGLR